MIVSDKDLPRSMANANNDVCIDGLMARIRSEMGNVQMLPDVAAQALDLAKNPDTSIDEFAKIIQRDVELAANVLSLANSAVFAAKPTASLQQSIARVGFNRCKNLILASSLSSLMKKMSLEEEWIRDVLWRHSVITAIIATRLNQVLRTGFDGEEFTAGLIHDLGRTLFAAIEPKRFSSFDPLDFIETAERLEAEIEAMGASHTDVAARYAAEQGLPEELVEVIRFHHRPDHCGNHQKLVALIAAADHLANHYHVHGEAVPYVGIENSALVLLELHRVPRAVELIDSQAAEILSDALESAKDLIAI